MKKVFTLIAGMLIVCGSITAQKKWTNLVVNGNMEGESPAYENLEAMQAEGAAWNSFWSHEFPKNEIGEEQYQGTATIVVDPTNPNNHCARVVARSEAIADSCENKTANNGALASWDCQFFIYATEAMLQDKVVRLTMKVRADKAGKAETQAHWAPGDYNHYQLFGDINVTTEWQTITTDEIIVSADQCKEADGKFFQTVAFNLSTDKEGNVFYFDEIKLEVKDQTTGPVGGEWVNFFRKGTLTNDKFGNFTTFTQRNGAVGKDEPAVVYDDPVDGQPTLKVSTVAWNTFVQQKDSIGEPAVDDDGNPIYDKYLIVDGDTILSSVSSDNKAFNDWQTQFFAMIGHKFKTNQPFRFKMWARAARQDGQPLEEEISIDTQIHTTPGGYIHYDFVGSLSVGEEWTPFEFGYDEENPKTIPSQGNGGQTIAFNCNKNKDVPVDLFFRFEELAFQDGVVLPNERVLASSSVRVPLSAENEGETTGTIDLNEALQVLEVPASDFAKFVDDSKTIKVKYVDAETEDDAYGDAQLSAGISIDANGNWTENQNNVITLEANEDETKDGILGLTISNYGVALEAGQTIDAKIAFEKDFWRYLVNVSFVEANAYAGVNEVKVTPKTNVMYDLQGRQLINAAKGLYIMNGKKVLVK